DELRLERSRVTFFPLSWTVVHPIDEASPLHGVTHEELTAKDAEFMILITGIDETFSQTVHARSSYKPDEIVYGHKFVSVYNPVDAAGMVSIDVRRLSDTEPAAGDIGSTFVGIRVGATAELGVRSAIGLGTRLANFRSFCHYFLAAGREDRFERLDSVVRRFEKEIFNHGFRAFQLIDQHLGMHARWHHAADLRGGAIANWLSENDHRPPFTGLREVVRALCPLLACCLPFACLSGHGAPISTRLPHKEYTRSLARAPA